MSANDILYEPIPADEPKSPLLYVLIDLGLGDDDYRTIIRWLKPTNEADLSVAPK